MSQQSYRQGFAAGGEWAATKARRAQLDRLAAQRQTATSPKEWRARFAFLDPARVRRAVEPATVAQWLAWIITGRCGSEGEAKWFWIGAGVGPTEREDLDFLRGFADGALAAAEQLEG